MKDLLKIGLSVSKFREFQYHSTKTEKIISWKQVGGGLCYVFFVVMTKFRKYIHNVSSARFNTTQKEFLQQQEDISFVDSHSCFLRETSGKYLNLNISV